MKAAHFLAGFIPRLCLWWGISMVICDLQRTRWSTEEAVVSAVHGTVVLILGPNAVSFQYLPFAVDQTFQFRSGVNIDPNGLQGYWRKDGEFGFVIPLWILALAMAAVLAWLVKWPRRMARRA